MEGFKYFQLASAYTQSLLSYSLDGVPKPFSASYVVSNQCNIHCHYCNFPSMTKAQLSLNEIDILFGKLQKMGVKRLGLLGGEPLIRKDIGEIIEIAKSKGLFVSMNSNLLLYEKRKSLVKKVDFWFTSIDGPPEIHIANRGKQNFEHIINAIRNIRQQGKKVIAICVVTNPNKAIADYLIDMAIKENIEIHFQPECYDTEIVQRSAPENQNQLYITEFWKYILKLKQSGAPVSSSIPYLKYIIQWKNYSISSYYDETTRCAAGRGFLFIDTEGFAYPCAYTKGKMQGINLITHDWQQDFDKKTPCTQCIVGPMLEFNVLFKNPAAAVANSLGRLQ